MSKLERKLREAIAERYESLSAFAWETNVSRVTLYHVFAGQYSRKMLFRIARELDLEPWEIVKWDCERDL